MGYSLSSTENLTDSSYMAKSIWGDVENGIKQAGREDILSNPAVLDIGGGMGNLSKCVNDQGVFCVSLEKQDVSVNNFVNPVRGDGYNLPFSHSTFDIVYERGIFDPRLYNLDQQKIIQEVARVLKRRGVFAVCDSEIPSIVEWEKHFKCISFLGYYSFWEKKD